MKERNPGDIDGNAGSLEDDKQSPRPTIRDVSRAFRVFLGREVESVAVAGHHIATSQNLWELIERLKHSAEAEHRSVGDALRHLELFHTRQDIALSATPEQIVRLHLDLAEAWERHGLGVYHQWLRRNEFRFDGRSERWNIEKSFERGAEEARHALDLLARHGCELKSEFRIAVLSADSFRLAQRLSPLVADYIGIEISSQDFGLAERAFATTPLINARAMNLTAFLEEDLEIDIFYSMMVLQHAPPPVALSLLRTFLERMRPGGLALFQLPSHLHGYGFETERYLAGEGRNPEGEIHAVPQYEVLALLSQLGCSILEIIPDSHIDTLGLSYLYVMRKGCS